MKARKRSEISASGALPSIIAVFQVLEAGAHRCELLLSAPDGGGQPQYPVGPRPPSREFRIRSPCVRTFRRTSLPIAPWPAWAILSYPQEYICRSNRPLPGYLRQGRQATHASGERSLRTVLDNLTAWKREVLIAAQPTQREQLHGASHKKRRQSRPAMPVMVPHIL